MERPTKVFVNGANVDGLSVGFKPLTEAWSEYQLDDGTIIKTRPVAVEFVRIPGQYDPEGGPIYIAKIQNVMAATAADSLRRQQ